MSREKNERDRRTPPAPLWAPLGEGGFKVKPALSVSFAASSPGGGAEDIKQQCPFLKSLSLRERWHAVLERVGSVFLFLLSLSYFIQTQ